MSLGKKPPADIQPPKVSLPSKPPSLTVPPSTASKIKAKPLQNNGTATTQPTRTLAVLKTEISEISHLQNMVLGQLENEPKYIAINCKMVSQPGNPGSLTRVTVVDFYGVVLFDTLFRQSGVEADYRTSVSGIRPNDLEGPKARLFAEVRGTVKSLLCHRTHLVGHALHHDLQALQLKLPSTQMHDVQQGATSPDTQNATLKAIVRRELAMDIQNGEHDSIVDARAVMAVFRARMLKRSLMNSFKPTNAKGLPCVQKDYSSSQATGVPPLNQNKGQLRVEVALRDGKAVIEVSLPREDTKRSEGNAT